ncbi:MAG: hypothetical protein FVQ82_02545 [Planctomycetes bacterium]|nr:hypothetical protein [Planctomycetota bacterium]
MEIGVLIAFFVAYVAWRQYKTDRDKLRLDLYDKRYEIYRALKFLLGYILQNGYVRHEQIMEFLKGRREDDFLFDKGIVAYLQDIQAKANELMNAEVVLENNPSDAERPAKEKEVIKLRKWFYEQHEIAIDKFGKYLKFEIIERPSQLPLIIIIITLGIALLLSNFTNNERYSVSSSGNTAFVVDTKTGQLWMRTIGGSFNLGTNEKPTADFININPKDAKRVSGQVKEFEKKRKDEQ